MKIYKLIKEITSGIYAKMQHDADIKGYPALTVIFDEIESHLEKLAKEGAKECKELRLLNAIEMRVVAHIENSDFARRISF